MDHARGATAWNRSPAAVIDLGIDRYDPAADLDPPRPPVTRQLRTAALVLAGALLLSVGGAAPPVPPRVEALHAVSLRVGTYFQLTEDRLFVTDPSPGTRRQVTAYDLNQGRRLWTNAYRTEHRQLRMSLADGLVLIADGDRRNGPIRTTALDAETGRWRWSAPNALRVLPGESTALAVEDVFPAGSRIDPDNPPPDAAIMHMSSSGGAYRESRIGVTARAVDLDSGRELWTTPLLAGAVPIPAAGGRPAFVLTWRDGAVEVRDLRAGAVVQRLDWTGGVPRNAELVGDVLVIWHATGVRAYSAALLTQRWNRPLPPGPDPYVGVCAPMLCLGGTGDVQVLDPATGVTAWRTDEHAFLTPGGGHLIETDDRSSLHRAVDPATGRTVVDLSNWSEAAGYSGDSPLLLLRRTGAAPRTWFDILDPGTAAVRPLDPVPYVLSSCQVVPGLIACRTDLGETRVWRYQ